MQGKVLNNKRMRQTSGYDANEAARLLICKSDEIVDWPLGLRGNILPFQPQLLNH